MLSPAATVATPNLAKFLGNIPSHSQEAASPLLPIWAGSSPPSNSTLRPLAFFLNLSLLSRPAFCFYVTPRSCCRPHAAPWSPAGP